MYELGECLIGGLTDREDETGLLQVVNGCSHCGSRHMVQSLPPSNMLHYPPPRHSLMSCPYNNKHLQSVQCSSVTIVSITWMVELVLYKVKYHWKQMLLFTEQLQEQPSINVAKHILYATFRIMLIR